MDEFSKMFSPDFKDAVSRGEAIFKGQKYRITVLSEILLRIEYSETGQFEDRPTEFAKYRNFDVPKFEVVEDDKHLRIYTEYFDLTYEKEKPMLGTRLSPDQFFKVKLVGTDKTWYFTQAEARNFRGTTSSIDDALTMPKLEKGLYSTDGFVSIDDSKTLIFNDDGSVGRRSDVRIDTYLFMYRKDFGYCLKDYYHLTGYPALIPRYALGVWWNVYKKYDANEIYSFINKTKKYEVPVSTIVLNDWSEDGIHFDLVRLPSVENLINECKNNNINIALKLTLDKLPAGIANLTSDVPFNVYDKNFMMMYFENVIDPLSKFGVEFYELDYNSKDVIAQRMINYYFYKYADYKKRGLILTKNGLVSPHLYNVYSSGEIKVDWRVLSFLPEYNSSSSNIGLSWWSHAIGGFKDGIEDSELYVRFVQFGVYNPIFRFASKEGHYYKREPWNWDVKTRKIVTDYLNVRHRLIPYLYSEAYKYSKTGLPIVQPLYYRYPELFDEKVYRNEYYFGTEFFVAPITEPKDEVMNRSVVKLFLPNGMWYDFKTGKKFPGGKRYISFFKDEDYPVFVRQGGIIPMAILDGENRNDTGNPKEMEIHIFPGKNNSYKLYEDDGKTNSYKNAEFLTTVIDYNYLPNNYTVIIRPLEGKKEIIPEKRKYKIRFRNTRKANDVIAYLGADPIQVKSYLDDSDFIVETDYISTAEQLSINCKGKDIEIDAVRLINEDIDTIISDLKIPTNLKEMVADIIFGEDDFKKKRIAIRKLKNYGLQDIFVKMFLKLLEYVDEF